MRYMTTAEAAEAWGVSIRQAQRLLAENRIPGAQKHGKAWMVPYDTEKPADPRRKKRPTQSRLSSDLARVVAATTKPAPSRNPDAILETVGEDRFRLAYEAEIAYLRGDFAQTMACFHKTGRDDALRLRVCPSAIVAAISMGDYRSYTEIDAYLKRCIKANKGSDAVAVAELALATAAVSCFAPHMAPGWLAMGDLSALPPPMRLNALYLRVKYLHCTHRIEAMLAVAQTALSLCGSEQRITPYDIYLRLMCAVAWHVLEREDEAKSWLLSAMRIGLPHGFITPFSEIVTAFGGLMEQCLKQAFPDYYNAVLEQWENTWGNWISFHNQFTKDNITRILSLREYHIALLVARHFSYAKIAKKNSISVGRLKNIMLDVYSKLFISGRDELANYIL
ncbi:MAG: helix-turn-helix domain-containing protein [Clostridia bacterium]|nr:helix-turn-helix domain-containing protein [Clostridia bacterium]